MMTTTVITNRRLFGLSRKRIASTPATTDPPDFVFPVPISRRPCRTKTKNQIPRNQASSLLGSSVLGISLTRLPPPAPTPPPSAPPLLGALTRSTPVCHDWKRQVRLQ